MGILLVLTYTDLVYTGMCVCVCGGGGGIGLEGCNC